MIGNEAVRRHRDPARRSAAVLLCLLLGALSLGWTAGSSTDPVPVEQATMLSAFGERPAFSPDGTRIAFVGQAYGDAYEIELATGHVRNLTAGIPHQGVLRVQYLDNGDYLISGPKVNIGPNSRLNIDLFVLDKDLHSGLVPLDQGVFEGVAIGPDNTIAWTQIPAGEGLRPGEEWIDAVGRIDFENWVGRIEYHDGTPTLVDRRRILTGPRSPVCRFAEFQDFREDGDEVVYYCGGYSITGYNLRTGESVDYVPYLPDSLDYNEVEGLSPDGTWAAVECGVRSRPGERVPPLDICRLDLVPGGAITKLVLATAPGSTEKASNPVVSPDGHAIAFQRADQAVNQPGEGSGIYLVQIPGA